MLVGRAWPTVWPLRSRYARPVRRAAGGDDGGTDADGSRRGQRQEQEKEVQRAARKRAEEKGRGATGPAHDLRDREAETERKRELVSHSGKNGGERGGAGVKQAGAALFGSAKEQKVAVTEKSRAIEQAIQQIEKQFGKGSIMKLGGAGEKIDAISTGSLAVDLALGVGGFPRGRVVEIYGPEASGKTTLALHAVASAQKAGGTAAFIDAEHALDAAWARTCGVSTDDLLISQPDNGQQALEIADTLVRSGAVDIVVIDSVAALVPRAEIEGEMGDAHVGLQARLMSQA